MAGTGLSLALGLTSLWVSREAHWGGVHWEGLRNGLGRTHPSRSFSEASLGNVGVHGSREQSGHRRSEAMGPAGVGTYVWPV